MLQVIPSAALAAEVPLKPAGRLRPRASKDVKASPISIGFETLDRKMFDPERCYAHLAQTGVKWARCQTGWARTETRRGEFDFKWLDGVVDSLRGIGVQPWFNLGYGNTLYTPGPKHESAVGWVPLNSEGARSAWVRYVTALATHFGKRVTHWELWNEPNIANFWQPDKPDPAKYVELVKLTAPVLRKTVPGSVLIGGAFAGLGAMDYFEGCFAAGLGDFVDKISYHPYRAVPEENYETELRSLRGIIRRYKPGLAVWQGENGAPSTNNSTGALSNVEWDEVRQAKWLLRRLMIDLALGVEVTSYFHTVDMVNYVWTTGQSNMTNSKGVLRGNEYTPKVSYYALQNLCSLFDSETTAADFAFRVDSPQRDVEITAVQTATFIRRNAPLCAFWYPANLQTGWQRKNVRLSLWTGKAAEFRKPVLVDLLTGLVYPLAGNGRVLNEAPLRDYPVLLTDESVL
jgi:hypothetical protein